MFNKNGPTKKRGCNRGDKCFYFHPALCENVLQMNCCLSENCKLVHIKGCKRSKVSPKADNKHSQPIKGKSNTGPKLAAKKTEFYTGDTRKTFSSVVQGQKSSQMDTTHSRSRLDSTTSATSIKSSSVYPTNNRRPNEDNNNEDFHKHLEKLKSDLKEMMSDMINTSLRSMLQLYAPQFHSAPS